jgi:hypothetical protein
MRAGVAEKRHERHDAETDQVNKDGQENDQHGRLLHAL